MANIVLVDYDNILPIDKHKGLYYVIDKIIRTISISELNSKNVTIRLYGGWYENNYITRVAQKLAAEINAHFPTTMVLADQKNSIVVSIEIAYSLLSEPTKHLFHTFRTRGIPSGLKCSNPTKVSGCLITNCPIINVHDFITKNVCSLCNNIKPDEILYRSEQKLVDTMLTSDLIFSATRKQSICIVSSDDDFWPGILTSLSLGSRITHVHTRKWTTNPFYLGTATSNYIQRQL